MDNLITNFIPRFRAALSKDSADGSVIALSFFLLREGIL